MASDDDILTGAVPEPDDEPSAAERARARTFAELVDKTLSGRTPPAMSADDRALLEVATVIRAASGGLALPAARQRAVVEDALRQAVGGGAATSQGQLAATPIARARARRWLPWLVAGTASAVAAAAVALLWLRAPDRVTAQPITWYSRPADPLIGQIPRARAGDAGERLDVIFADRLDGYRDRRWAGRAGGRP